MFTGLFYCIDVNTLLLRKIRISATARNKRLLCLCFSGFFFSFPLAPDLFSHSPGSITPSGEVSFPLQSHEFRSAVVLLLPFKFSFWRALDIKNKNLPHIFCSCF